jgi:hypothetical protein
MNDPALKWSLAVEHETQIVISKTKTACLFYCGNSFSVETNYHKYLLLQLTFIEAAAIHIFIKSLQFLRKRYSKQHLYEGIYGLLLT